MNTSRKLWIIVFAALWISSVNLPVSAQEEEQDLDAPDTAEAIQEQEETLEVLETVWAEETSIASRVTSSVAEAPSVVTVITAQQIQDMGARTLVDVLKVVPGFDPSSHDTSGFPNETFVGPLSVLVLHNGARLNDYYSGASSGTEYQIFLDNVERIEIIRGPGSALYGANAFAGVINIITKTPDQIDGIQIGDERSSFNGQRYHLLAGKQLGDWSASLFAHYFQDDGQKFFIPADQLGHEGHIQDKQMGAIDLDLQTGYKDLSVELRYLHRKPHVFFYDMVIQPSSDEDLRVETETLSLRGAYQRSFSGGKGEFNVHTEYKRTTLEAQFARDYPLQVYDKIPTDDVAGEVSVMYSFFDRHTTTVGVRLGHEQLFDSVEKINFHPDTGAYLGVMTEIPSNNPDSDRTIVSAYGEDVWELSDHVHATIGARMDNYTQFGSTVNPRCALVYMPISKLALKLMYGSAFRAPTAIEAYDANFGTEDIEPERLHAYEASVSYDLFHTWTIQGNYYYGSIDDLIYVVEDPTTYSGFSTKNVGGILGRSAGVELRGTFPTGYVWATYIYGHFETKEGEVVPGVVEHSGSTGINVEIGKYVNVNLWGYFRGDRLLKEGSSRSKLDSYTITNLNLRIINLLDNLEGYLTVYNLFDTEYKLPGLYGLTIPAHGREIIGGIRYIF
jgi:iron complex outermembrane receptor protein